MRDYIRVTLLAVMIVVCIERNVLWMNDSSLWGDSIEKSPNKARGYNELALSAVLAGDYKKALETFSATLRLNPYLPQAYTNIGLAYEGLNQVDMAILAYQKAITLFPDDPTPYYNLGLVYYKQKHDLDKAFESLQKARDLNPIEPDVHLYLGFIYRDKGNAAQSIEEFSKYTMLK